ncbi:hypothetical protein ACFQWB_02205 [Paenibacillus thermoaerophilus]|uniref:Uncharacterized protein n=1 Tax=Paenibacillus thermoaerophilus TaxID=1215385 RepID=A0ABW2UXY4_9BACL|nr:hypothetical protein [Paenibacillus thermoaerophilus]TMV19156.1 hypothetical protein FE781_01215 [Paenibacillus thermoaerophilus]
MTGILKAGGYAVLAGVSLAAFTHNAGGGLFKYAFSLLALVIAIRFFRSHDGLGIRIGFVLTAIVFSFIFSLMYSMLALAYGWPLDPAFTETGGP